MVIFSAKRLSVKLLTTTAKQPHPWELGHDDVGYNYRMPNLPMYRHCQSVSIETAQWLEDRLVNIPSSVRI
jgi:perosamine synthetase